MTKLEDVYREINERPYSVLGVVGGEQVVGMHRTGEVYRVDRSGSVPRLKPIVPREDVRQIRQV